MFLEETEFDREEAEEENDELRAGPAYTVDLTAELTVFDEGGAAGFFLIGSAAASTNVLLFEAGSGTGPYFVRPVTCEFDKYIRLEIVCLRTGAGGGIVPVFRALFVDADISARPLSGDEYRLGWGS